MWGETQRIGNYIDILEFTPEIVLVAQDILLDNARDTLLHGFWKQESDIMIVKKRQIDDPYACLLGWHCKVLPVSSMESFQFHIGRQFDYWFMNNFHFFRPGKIWRTWMKIKRTRGFYEVKYVYKQIRKHLSR